MVTIDEDRNCSSCDHADVLGPKDMEPYELWCSLHEKVVILHNTCPSWYTWDGEEEHHSDYEEAMDQLDEARTERDAALARLAEQTEALRWHAEHVRFVSGPSGGHYECLPCGEYFHLDTRSNPHRRICPGYEQWEVLRKAVTYAF